MRYKRDMERKLGMDEGGDAAPVVGLPGGVSSGSGAPGGAATAGAPAARNFGAEDDDDDDDIYD